MKRARDHYTSYNYSETKAKYDAIDMAFINQDVDSFTKLAEQLKNLLSMPDCQLLLLKLNSVIKNNDRQFSLALKNSLFRLASIAFTNIEQVINRPPEAFYSFIAKQKNRDTQQNKPGQSLAFIIYHLG